MTTDRLVPADRGVSTPLAYVLNLAIATVLITGLIVAGTTFITDRRASVVETELKVVGQQIASDVQQADRLVDAQTSSTDPSVSIRQRYPREVAGASYTIVLRETSSPTRQYVNLSAAGGVNVSVAVRVPTQTAISDGSAASGGPIEVTYADTDGDGNRDALVIRNDD